jgi:hypothetical protein
MESAKSDLLKRVKELITNSTSIYIAPSPALEKDSFPASLALFYSLRDLEKNVNLLVDKIPERFSFLANKKEFQLGEVNFLISIREKRARITQISYQKTDHKTNLYLKTSGGLLKKEDVSLKPLSPKGALITLGVSQLAEIEPRLERKNIEAVINIDNKTENSGYGDINLISPQETTFSEMVLDLLKIVSPHGFGEKVSNALLAGLIQEISLAKNKKLNPQIFKKISFLMEKGANYQKIASNLHALEKENSFKLFQRVLNKLDFLPEQGLGWASLTREDFRQTNTYPKNLSFVIEKLISGIFPFQNLLLLWESKNSPSTVWGVFYSPEEQVLEKIKRLFGAERKGNGLVFKLKNNSQTEAPQQISEIIAESLKG